MVTSHDSYIVHGSVSVINGVTLAVIFFKFFKDLGYYSKQKAKTTSRSIPKNIYLTAIFCFCSMIIGNIGFGISYITYYFNSNQEWFIVLAYIDAWLCNIVRESSVLLFVGFRLINSFENSAFALGNKFMIFLIVIIIIADLLYLVYGFALYNGFGDDFGQLESNKDTFMQKLTLIMIIVICILHILSVCVMTYLFCKKLLQLTVLIRKSTLSTNLKNNESNEAMIEFSSNQTKLLQLVAKQTILAIIDGSAVIVSNVIVIVVLILDFDTLFWSVSLNVTDVAIAISIWFSFKFGDKYYYYFCRVCHMYSLRCCHNQAINQIKKQNQKYTKVTGMTQLKVKLSHVDS